MLFNHHYCMCNLIILLCCLLSLNGVAQVNFEKVGEKKNMHVTVKVLGPELVVVVPDDNSTRFSAGTLPKELQQDGLQLTVSGDIGKIPPNVRMIGTPFRITKICLTKAMQQQYKLKKRKYAVSY